MIIPGKGLHTTSAQPVSCGILIWSRKSSFLCTVVTPGDLFSTMHYVQAAATNIPCSEWMSSAELQHPVPPSSLFIAEKRSDACATKLQTEDLFATYPQ